MHVVEARGRMSRNKQKEAATMSNEEEDARQYRCFKKYEEIVKQVLLIDEMTDTVDHGARYQRRRRNSRGSGTATTSMPDQGNIDGRLVQTITRFLNELNTNAMESDPKPSSNP